MPLAACGATHLGRRSINEDAWLVESALGLLVVADGMGGHSAGEVASALAVEAIRGVMVAASEPPSGRLLERAILVANDDILKAAARVPEQSGMGTTVVAAVVSSGHVYYASVGDSRIYLWNGSDLAQLTKDDSWLAETSNSVPTQDLPTHPMRHVLTKVVGLRSDMRPTVGERALAVGDGLLLCSDGVHGTLRHGQLAEMFARASPVTDLAGEVVRTAIESGATDNATAIVARLEE